MITLLASRSRSIQRLTMATDIIHSIREMLEMEMREMTASLAEMTWRRERLMQRRSISRWRCISRPLPRHPAQKTNSLFFGDVGDGDAGDDCISRRDDLETRASHAETAHLSMDRLPTVAFHALLSRRPVRVDVNGGISAVISVIPDLLDL